MDIICEVRQSNGFFPQSFLRQWEFLRFLREKTGVLRTGAFSPARMKLFTECEFLSFKRSNYNSFWRFFFSTQREYFKILDPIFFNSIHFHPCHPYQLTTVNSFTAVILPVFIVTQSKNKSKTF